MLCIRPTLRKFSCAVFIVSAICLLPSCSVYTVSKGELEETLRQKRQKSSRPDMDHHFIALVQSGKIYNNNIDTLECSDEAGKPKLRKIKYDSKILIHTRHNKTIKYYTRTLYLWKDEFIIGERTAPSFYGPNIYPIRLSDVEAIKLK